MYRPYRNMDRHHTNRRNNTHNSQVRSPDKRRMKAGLSVRQVVALVMGTVVMFAILTVVIVFQLSPSIGESLSSPWHYECESGLCKKVDQSLGNATTRPLPLGICQLFCGEAGAIWPKPTGHLSLGNFVVHLNPDNIKISETFPQSRFTSLLKSNVQLLKRNVKKLGRNIGESTSSQGLVIHVAGKIDTNNVRLTLDTKENYTLQIYQMEDGRLNATIIAESYFGVRHALETISQLIVYDELRQQIHMVRDVFIVDGPAYPYRGILLDTSRNFVDKATILRTIEAMSMTKLNTLHWHITDSHSFPYVSRTWPNMSFYGAYAPHKIYTHEDVEEIVEFGLLNGVRVLPELDAPAHVGEGWQWVGDNATLCFKAEPWKSYCVEPPCGQLNPASDRVYEILEGIYKDMVQDFHPDIFHMGGDEINLNCWNSSSHVREWMLSKGWNDSESSFFKVWDYFQSKALEKLTLANGGQEIPVVLWTSGLTEEDTIHYLDPKKYIIQIWTSSLDATIARLIKNNFRVIFSNYDALYLDCGFGAWVGEGNNWCSPYKGWQLLYDNSPFSIIAKQGFGVAQKKLVLGGEVTLWTEQADGTSVDSRLWPRAAAFAERLWSEPDSTWIHAEQRMLRHRERLVQRGIKADSLEPEWCLQNQGHCYA